MSTLLLSQYQRMRLDVGLAMDDTASLPDEVIDDAYARVGAFYTDPTSQNASAHVVILTQLRAREALTNDYTANQHSEKASQRFDHYGKLLEDWQRALDNALAVGPAAAGVVRSGRTRRKPPRLEEYPDTLGPDGTLYVGWGWRP